MRPRHLFRTIWISGIRITMNLVEDLCNSNEKKKGKWTCVDSLMSDCYTGQQTLRSRWYESRTSLRRSTLCLFYKKVGLAYNRRTLNW